MSVDIETKFAHLLRPIRDMVEAWNIDVAAELEQYLAELDQIHFTFDQTNALNFAQAALLIQGSAAVFSRKVDYLHSLVFQTLDLITTKKAQKERKQRAGAAHDDDQVWAELMNEEHEVLLRLDDIAVLDDADTRLRDDEELILGPSLLARTSKLTIVREKRLMAATSAYDAAATSRRAALLLRRATATNNSNDPFGSSFRLNSSRIHPSGAVVLDPNDAARPFGRVSQVHVGSSLAHARHREMTAADAKSIVAMTPGLKSARAQRETPAKAPVTPYRGEAVESGGGFGDSGGFDDGNDVDDTPNVQRAMTFGGDIDARDPNRLLDDAAHDDGNGADDEVWTFLDPHSTEDNPPAKPFRAGNTQQNVEHLIAKVAAANEAATSAMLEWPQLPSDVYINATDAELSALLRNVTLAEFAPARQRTLHAARRAAPSVEDADDHEMDDVPAAADQAPMGDGGFDGGFDGVGSSRVDLQACKLEYSIVSPK